MLALALLIWAVAEILVAIKVAAAIGGLLTLLLLVAGWPLGTWALRTRGRAAWRRLSAAIAAGRAPGREVIDGALVLIAGLLLIVPGFISDALAIALLLPPARALARRLLVRNLQSRIVLRAANVRRPGTSYDVDSTATDVRPRPLER